MNSTESPEQGEVKNRRVRRTNIWIAISLFSSSVVLAWSFYASVRHAGQSADVPTAGESEGSVIDLAERARMRRTRAEEFRDAALALDQEFMRTIREKTGRPENLPGNEHSRRHWDRHVELVKRQVRLVGDPEEGTIEWKYRQKLIESVTEDSPE